MTAVNLGAQAGQPRLYGSSSRDTDTYVGRLIRAIPADVTAGYVMVTAFVPTGSPLPGIVVAACFTLLTPAVVAISASIAAGHRCLPIKAMSISTAAFLAWVVSLPDSPLQTVLGYEDWARALVLVGATTLLGLVHAESSSE